MSKKNTSFINKNSVITMSQKMNTMNEIALFKLYFKA